MCIVFISQLTSSCSDDFLQVNPDNLSVVPFELKASQSTSNTRVELGQDGLTVKWEPGDQLVLVEKSRTKAPIYLSCTLTEPATRATFVSESGVPAGDYWVIYNYNENLAYTHQSFSSVDEINAQDKLVLYGELNITAGTSSASVTMQHLYAMINIKLENIPGFNVEGYYSSEYRVGIYSSKKGFGEYKLFTSEGIVNASYENTYSNGMYNQVLIPSNKRRHNLQLGNYNIYQDYVDDGTMTGNGSYQNNIAQLEANSALVLPEDLSDEDVYFYVLLGNDWDEQLKCWEIKKPAGKVNLKAGRRYTIVLDMSDTNVNTHVSTLSKVQSGVDGNSQSYGISTPLDLRHLAYGGFMSVQLLNDIDLSNEVFFPISASNFNGAGKIIRNLTIERPEEDCVGFSESVMSISDLTLENAVVKGKNFVGGFSGGSIDYIKNCRLIGSSQIMGSGNYVGGIIAKMNLSNSNSNISNVSVGQNCQISGSNYVGGIVGAAVQPDYSLYFSNSVKPLDTCIFEGSINATGDYVGGIFGKWGGNEYEDYTNVDFSMEDYSYTMLKCQNIGSVKGNNYVGGIGGSFAVQCYNGGTDRVVLKQSFSNGTVEGNTFVGGITGSSMASINTCYTVNTVKGIDKVGGIAGCLEVFGYNGRVVNCYSLSRVEATNTGAVSGGLIGTGVMGTTLINSYFAGSGTSYGIVGYSYGGCSISNCLTTLDNFCSNWGDHYINNGDGSYDNYQDYPLDPINDDKVRVGVTSILANKEFINSDNAYSDNIWSGYQYECVKFDSFSAETDIPGFGDDVID